MSAPLSSRARGLFGGTLLCGVGCVGRLAFELPASMDVPPHACADAGLEECERACKIQSDGDACLVAAAAYAAGYGTPVDEASMHEYERRACKLGVARGCEQYAKSFSLSNDDGELAAARELFERACEGGRAESCALAGGVALRLDAAGQPRDPRAAFELYERACDRGVAGACSTVGDMLSFGIGTAVDAERAAASYRKACAGDDDTGCHNAAGESGHWITAPAAAVLLEQLHAPDPSFTAEGAPTDWRAKLSARICFAHDTIEPVAVRIVESSGIARLNAIIDETLQEWRYRARPGWTFERPVCVGVRFDIRRE